MLHQEFEPPDELRDAIKCFWYNRMDFGEQLSSFEVVPDGYAEIIFPFGSPCSIGTDDGLQPLPSPFMVGLLDRPVLFHATNRLEIIGIRCFPWTVFDLLGLPSDKDAIHAFVHPITQLQSTIKPWIEAGKITKAIAQAKAYFQESRSQATTDSLLSKAGAALQDKNGTLPVSEIATAAHATVRTLERKFKKSSGYTVKEVSGLMRFEQVRNRLWLYPNTNIAELAQELGYTDQAHLSREFKRYTGTTPAAFARSAKKRKLSVIGDIVAFIQS